MLLRWYREYKEIGNLHKQHRRRPRYTREQMQAAVGYYLEHGRNVSRAIRAVGYPTRGILSLWCLSRPIMPVRTVCVSSYNHFVVHSNIADAVS